MKTDFIKKVCLGTAQFGMAYGVANKRGQIPKKEVFEILKFASSRGITSLDTAFNYGESEAVIGEFSQRFGVSFDVVSKLPSFSSTDEITIKRAVLQSLHRLNSDCIDGYLIHSFGDFLSNEKLWALLSEFKEQHIVKQIGFSLYTIEELKVLLGRNIAFDIVQLPYSIFDQRFEPYFNQLKERGVTIYARSVFLQGLFFLEAKTLPEKFASIKPQLERLQKLSLQTKKGIHALCLGFINENPAVDKIIVGVDSLAQLRHNLDVATLDAQTMKELRALHVDNEFILLPYNWK